MLPVSIKVVNHLNTSIGGSSVQQAPDGMVEHSLHYAHDVEDADTGTQYYLSSFGPAAFEVIKPGALGNYFLPVRRDFKSEQVEELITLDNPREQDDASNSYIP